MLFALQPIDNVSGYGAGILSDTDAKAHLGVLSSDQDTQIGQMRDAAVAAVEQECDIRLDTTEGIVAVFEGFPEQIDPGIGPVASRAVTAISYVGSDGSAVNLTSSDWRMDAYGRAIPAIGTSWPTSYGPVSVTFSAGYDDDNRPALLVHAVKLALGHFMINREADIADMPGVTTICDRYRTIIL